LSTERQDGRILPATHWASLVVFVILVPAVIVLWGRPGNTADDWSWTIKPDLTPIFLGAGYGAGAIDLWPWQLTPLTSRVLGSFTAQVGAGALLLSGDPRWGSWRLIVQTFFVGVALLLVGAVRAWDDFDMGNPLTYAYVVGLAAQALALALLYRRMSAA